MFLGKHAFVILLLVLVLSACGPKEPSGCITFRPEGFSESDLIGTWRGTIKAPRDSTIIVAEDGRYRQSINIEKTGFKYDGDWKPWRVTYSDEGLPYVHFKDFVMCAYWRDVDCKTGKSSITPIVVDDTKDPFSGEYYWYDDCQKEWVETTGEAVFIVIRTTDYYPRGINLVTLSKSSDAFTAPSYSLREP
jgi:hypothetical protein